VSGFAKAKKIVLTRHAEQKLEERNLKPEWVERTVREPLWVEPEPHDKSAERRFATIEEFGGRTLRVVCVETEDAIRVITALFDRDARSDR
jgi:uncharacterized DUF497 family protein